MRRRDLLKGAGVLSGGAVVAHWCPPALAAALAPAQAPAPASGALAAMRAQMAAAPIEVTKINFLITMYSGPGGNVLVMNGGEGKIVVDTFVQGAFAGLQQRLAAGGGAPVALVINTHWHFDHSDNNESFRQAGAQILAQVNTRRRLAESHELLGMQVPPAPPGALPTQTFERTYELKPGVLYEEFLDIGAFAPAHTDSDLFVRFALGDIIHLGDIFVNGSYPFIDAGTGGSMAGMLAATERALKMTNPQTQIVPGHGPLADRAALTRYRDMLTTVRDRVQRLKTAGRTAQEVVAAKPTADLDATWGKGFLTPDNFVSVVYNTL